MKRKARDQCPFISHCKQKVYFNLYIYYKLINYPEVLKKINVNFGHMTDRFLSVENICHGFLMLHRRWITFEYKYWSIYFESFFCCCLIYINNDKWRNGPLEPGPSRSKCILTLQRIYLPMTPILNMLLMLKLSRITLVYFLWYHNQDLLVDGHVFVD